ncbi:MAG: hypothetical protein FWD87_07695 [Spirochaetaceae bacterium]|nr:hypothetical protein [Spirochaetaceae bacterium]
MMELPNVTLAALSSVKIWETIQAIKYSAKKIKFGDCVFISHKKPFWLPQYIRFEQTTELKNIDAFNYKMLFELYKYIKTDFVLLVHYDGFVVNPDMWRSEFLDYDYIGSPWADNFQKDIYGNTIRVGNGVSIRSKKLLELPAKFNMQFNFGEGFANHEDTFICCRYRHFFLQHGIKYAPLEVAKYFGHEAMIPEIEGIKPFLFHQWNGSNRYYKKFGGKVLELIRRFERRVKQGGTISAIGYYFNKYIKKKKNTDEAK